METDHEPDLISELPIGIIETILTKLPIRDAVQTCILSTKWRYKWASLTHLIFDDRITTKCDLRVQGHTEYTFLNFVTRCLFLHEGPIHKFSLCSSYLKSSPNIDQLLLFISRKAVKELSLELGTNDWFTAPSCIFLCKNLTHLKLVRCELNPPSNFDGFSCLKYLTLKQVSMPRVDIECLMSRCPLLESLTLSHFDCLELTLRAPNLKYLILDGYILEYCEQSSSCRFEKLLGGVPKLERLNIHYTKHLSTDCTGNSRKLSTIIFHDFKFIELHQVGFDDVKEIFIVLQLIVNSPNLKALQISGLSYTNDAMEAPDLQLWDKKSFIDCTFNQLKTVKLSNLSGEPHEMKLIKFLLERSPCLEEMSIMPRLCLKERRLNMLIDLVGFRRASPRASINFIHELV
ncbi:hypothetical protein CASFOL_004031 [Castilleja foliolosa]|uniref:F-box domain-containing protein n=1 Tax=Castilleja foliolosa TaxID=1961234 RepID=A0ABD3EJ96_9LAMI